MSSEGVDARAAVIPRMKSPRAGYGHVLVFTFMLFAVAYSVEHYFLIVPKYSVAVLALMYSLLIAAEAGKMNIRRLPWSARALGVHFPLFILIVGALIAVYRLPLTYPVYVLGDCFVIGQFVMLGLIFSLRGIEKQADLIFWGFFVSTIITSLAAFYFSYTFYYAEAGRFIPFDILFVIAAAWYAFYRRSLVALIILSVLLAMAAMSGMRLGFFLMFMMTFFVMFVARKRVVRINRISLAGFALVAIFAVFAAFNASKIESMRTIARFAGTFEGDKLELVSVNSRQQEAATAVHEQLAGSPFFVLFGNGHGALYKGLVSWDLAVNLTPKGTHNIHVSPALFFFRYGIPGIAWYVLLILYGTKRAVKILFMRPGSVVNDRALINALYLFAMLMSSILGQNNFIYSNIPVALFLDATYEKLAEGRHAAKA